MKEQEVTIEIRASLIGHPREAPGFLATAISRALATHSNAVVDDNGNRLGTVRITHEDV